MLGALARLLELAVAELAVVFGELGRVDYPAIAQAASTALGSVDDPTELALRLDNRIRHILVDEFQDTSLEQTRLLAQLTAGWEPVMGARCSWWGTRCNPSTVFARPKWGCS